MYIAIIDASDKPKIQQSFNLHQEYLFKIYKQILLYKNKLKACYTHQQQEDSFGDNI